MDVSDQTEQLVVSFSLTHVTYEKGDRIGQFLAISSLSPLIILISLVTLCAFRRDLHTFFFLTGQIINEGFNWLLKHWIKEPRPPIATAGGNFGKYGFPSSHAQFTWFFAVYMTLFTLIRIYLGHHTWRQVWWGSVIGIFVGVLWFLLVNCVLTPWFPVIISWPICEWLLIRDFTLIPNILFFEYACVRKEAQARQRKLRDRSDISLR